MLNQDIIVEEDEDVIFEGSALHEHLSTLGYADFETIPVIRTQLRLQDKSIYMDNIINDISKKIYKYILTLRSWITQDCCLSKEQLHTILNAEALLDDHAAVINSYAQKYTDCMPWKKTLQNFFVNSTMIASSTYLLFYKYQNALNIIMTFCALYFTGYRNYSDIQAYKELKQLVLLQNEFYNLCKKGLKILKHGYKVKINSGKINQQFHGLMGEKLIYLQPIMENLVKSTTFEDNAFKIRGEINYEALIQLYHTYILVQSELLYLLAVAYDINACSLSRDNISKASLIYITNTLIEQLTKYKNKLSPYINSYYNCKVEPILHNYKGSVTSKWQDVYLHLNLTSNKIQLAYDYIVSMINDIDTCTDDTSITNNEVTEKIMQKMNEAYKQIDAARNFAEFCSLLITKTKHTNSKISRATPETSISNVDVNLPVVIDTEPEILDEVFEEYIKEEYLKPLYEEDQEILLQEYKLDKLLAKNFMSELKEALIDKQRSMFERESKALQRMYRNVMNNASDLESRNSKSSIPIPPPMPSLINNFVPIYNNDSISHNSKNVSVQSTDTSNTEVFCKKTLYSNNDTNVNNLKEYTNTNNASVIKDSKEDSAVFQPLSLKDLEQPIVQFGLNISPLPLRPMNEETFIGSGENSESDIEPEND
ncbi:hypothetical protein KPH14_001154 [Odynerus spinipes]|uniref:Uncharacterized protein n=1 Tax=Odynerus spinipes TaxID=1348599 RepID=A0AAD9VRW4_9HYME|nr:hypothetical protein KPH14_001154 [Odynerus spinipes]